MAVYTKTGDKGKTSTFGGKRISKSSKLISAIGAIDELNSYLGIVGGLINIQKNLFIINSILSGAKIEFPKDATKKLETEIDEIERRLPVLQNFIIYGGTKRAVQLFYARVLCRRAERALVDLRFMNNDLGILRYINRLSDYLFVIARAENYRHKNKEIVWKV